MSERSSSDRLHLLYELNRGLTTFSDLGDLLRYATRRARELFGAEGCAILMLDRDSNEFYFPIASESDAASEVRLASLRFPSNHGVAGWVLANDKALLVPDVSKDERFYEGVDQKTQMTTRALICAPLRSPSGNIGVIEIVNPAGEFLSDDDVEFLEALAGDVAVACEKTQLYDQLRGEVFGLRQACRLGGLGLLGIGVLALLGAIVRQVAWALPMSELPSRPGLWIGVLAVAIGSGLFALGQGWWSGPVTKAGGR